jgi:hypothetical protein
VLFALLKNPAAAFPAPAAAAPKLAFFFSIG